ncbi:MAG: type IV pilus modification PilV family protein [Thermodesulfobacteriota bacterium]
MKIFYKTKGFSLLELLVALVILSLSLVALAGLTTTSTKNNAYSYHITEAVTLAQDKLEELRAMPLSDIYGNSDNRTGSTGINYTRIWVVRDLIKNDDNEVISKEIEMTIQWEDLNTHSLRFLSTISEEPKKRNL